MTPFSIMSSIETFNNIEILCQIQRFPCPRSPVKSKEALQTAKKALAFREGIWMDAHWVESY